MIENLKNAIVIAGHSHTAALIGNAHVEGDFRLLPVEGYDGIFGLHGPLKNGFPVRAAPYWDALARCAVHNRVAVIYGGNESNFRFLFEDSTPFDFVLRSLQSLPVNPDAIIVPEALVRAQLQALLGQSLDGLLSDLKARARFPVILLGTPPPKGDHDLLQRFLPPEFPQLKLTSAIVRLKLWRLFQELYEEKARLHDLDFLPASAEAMDEHGFLKPRFWANDLTHANSAYGRLMLECLARRRSTASESVDN